MEHRYAPLPAHHMDAGTTFQQPLLPEPKPVALDDPALEVMTDFQKVRALTVPAETSMDYAYERMRSNRVHLLLVVDERNEMLGLITSTDVEGEKPVRLVQERAVGRDELLVADVMTPRERLEVIEFDDVQRARVGQVVATLQAVGRQHAMIVDRDERGRQRVRGLFSANQLGRQLGTVIHALAVARSFAEIEEALAH